jgi:hypothetical protein
MSRSGFLTQHLHDALLLSNMQDAISEQGPSNGRYHPHMRIPVMNRRPGSWSSANPTANMCCTPWVAAGEGAAGEDPRGGEADHGGHPQVLRGRLGGGAARVGALHAEDRQAHGGRASPHRQEVAAGRAGQLVLDWVLQSQQWSPRSCKGEACAGQASPLLPSAAWLSV